MSSELLLKTIPCGKFDLLNKGEVVTLYKGAEKTIGHLQSELERLSGELASFEQKSFFMEEDVIALKKKIFGASSEKRKPLAGGGDKGNKGGNKGKKRVQLSSKRYPNVPVEEIRVDSSEPLKCDCCGETMCDSGLTEDSEELTYTPRKYKILRYRRVKYHCGGCHGPLKAAPAKSRILPGSSYSDDMIVDITMSKYLDLIPIERYVEIAARDGLEGLPQNSLIGLTHHLANFIMPVYEKIRSEVMSAEILHADETPHRMLEGSSRKAWYLWGFSVARSVFFEIRDTRSGDVASSILKESNCKYLMTDRYSGYGKAVNESNKYRKEKGLHSIIQIYCNAHSRRYFIKAEANFKDKVKFFIWCYQKIYHIRKRRKEIPALIHKLKLSWENIYMRAMEREALDLHNGYSSKSSIGKAVNYLLNSFEGLSLFSKIEGLPIDNTSQERTFRAHVVGRKTWYGTHSKRGAKTASVHLTITESCKLNKINSRLYMSDLVNRTHNGLKLLTPREYAELISEVDGKDMGSQELDSS